MILIPTRASEACAAWKTFGPVSLGVPYVNFVENPFGLPQSCSSCFAFATSPVLFVPSGYAT